jgi:hypothetical protein
MDEIKYRKCTRCLKNCAESLFYERINKRPMKTCKRCVDVDRKNYAKRYQDKQTLSDENKQYKELLFKLLQIIDTNDDMQKLKSILV